MANLIQKFVFPDPELSDCRELYFRGPESLVRVEGGAENPQIALDPGASLATDTFFNCLSLSPWVKATHLKQTAVEIRLRGSCDVSVCHIKNPGAEAVLQTEKHPGGVWRSKFFDLQSLQEGLLYVRIQAITAVELEEISFVTEEAPAHPVKLGMVITTFNRQKQTLGAIRRLSKSIQELPPEERDQYKILVIDNGRNLDFQSTDLCEVIPNANLGGTGGFMKGLIELQTRGSFTHCLFMDDDASCFFESVARTKRFFEYSSHPKLAIAGSMLLEKPSYIQNEFTAYLKRICRPRLSELDLRQVGSLLQNDLAANYLTQNLPLPSEKGADYTYGGWWFFAFAIEDLKVYSFPFFVRADDVFFSIHNGFSVLAINGIASWQESFATKNQPFVNYLVARGDLVQTVLLPKKSAILRFLQCLWLIYYTMFRNLFIYRYQHAHAGLLALRDFMKAPEFWYDNLEFNKHLNSVSTQIAMPVERFSPHEVAEHGAVPKQGIFARLIRLILLNGHLCPSSLLKNGIVAFKEGSTPPASFVFGKAAYAIKTTPGTDEFNVFRRDPRLFWKLALSGIFWSLWFVVSFPGLYRRYNASQKDLMSMARWKKVFADSGI